MQRSFGLILTGLFLIGFVACPNSGAAQESGSVERSRNLRQIQPRPAQSGSTERMLPQLPIPFPLPQDSGSQEKPGRWKTEPGSAGSNSAKAGDRDDGGSDRYERDYYDHQIPLRGWWIPILMMALFLAGLFVVGWAWFRMGWFNPYTNALWPKRLELYLEIAQRFLDDFMAASRDKKFEQCQHTLDAINHLNARRTVLLSNEINSSINQFVEKAVRAQVSQNDEAFQKEFSRQYELTIEALRLGARQEELSLEVLRSLTKAQGPHRRLKDSAPETDSETA